MDLGSEFNSNEDLEAQENYRPSRHTPPPQEPEPLDPEASAGQPNLETIPVEDSGTFQL